MPTTAEQADREFFQGDWTPAKVSARYQLGLFVVATAMILLPLIYLGIVGVVAWGTYCYAAHAFDVFFPVVGGERQIYFPLLILYLAPLCVGGILSLFLFKPFFARWPGFDASRPISHLDHPLLFRFIGQLCQQMGAPIPSRIDVSVAVGASAGFREGFRSFSGNDIKLTLGLPLAASMTCREFSCVVAHELGHFTQRTAMRLGFVIYSVNRWLCRAVYERDEFDAWIEEAMAENSLNLVIFGFARAAVGCTRGLLWLLLVAGHALSSFMSRQMEFHADSCAIGVAGTNGFVSTLQRVCILERCSEKAAVEFRNRVAPKLPDDLPTYLAMLAAQCAGQTQGKILRQAAGARTRWSYSHPADSERIAQAIQSGAPGLIVDSRPATALFGDFRKLSAELTAQHYTLMNRGRPIAADRIFHVQPTTDAAPDTSAEEAAIEAYFGGLGMFLRPILIDSGARLTVGLAANKLAQLTQARQTLVGKESAGLVEQIAALDSRMLRALQAEAACQAGIEIAPETSGVSAGGRADPAATLNEIENQREEAALSLEPLEQTARQRLMTALSLLRTPAAAAVVPDVQQLHDEVHDLLHVMAKLSAAFPALLQARRESAVLGGLLALRGDSRSVPIEEAIADSTRRLMQDLARIHEAFGSAQYPFDPPEQHRTIVDYARSKQYDPDPARMACQEAESHLGSIVALYYRLLARLIQIAMQVEEPLAGTGPSAA